MIVEKKKSLRALARRMLAALPPSRSGSVGKKIRAHLEAWPLWREAASVCAFSALASEPDVLVPWPAGKRVLLPRVATDRLTLHVVGGRGELVRGNWGVWEPAADASTAPARADMILVPGLAFDAEGGRLGRGGGFYDRLLEGFAGVRVGVCFQERLLNEIPREPHDARMDFLATPSGIISCGPRSRRAGSGG
jgi:5-formyltetrahydrofolate cyclo-ligase